MPAMRALSTMARAFAPSLIDSVPARGKRAIPPAGAVSALRVAHPAPANFTSAAHAALRLRDPWAPPGTDGVTVYARNAGAACERHAAQPRQAAPKPEKTAGGAPK
jgi:hypothetical protein